MQTLQTDLSPIISPINIDHLTTLVYFKAPRVGTFKVCVAAHIVLHMFIVLASRLPFQAERNAELAVPPLFRSVKCEKIRGHVALRVLLLFIRYTAR